MSWTLYTLFVLYLAGVGGLAHVTAWGVKELAKEDPRIGIALEMLREAVCLWLALAVCTWPVSLPLIAVLALRRKKKKPPRRPRKGGRRIPVLAGTA